MKNVLILILSSIILLSFSTKLDNNFKLAYIDSSFIHETPEIMEINARIEIYKGDQERKWKLYSEEVQEALEDGNKSLYIKKDKELQEMGIRMEEAIKNKESELIQPYLEQVNEKIAELATEGNYAIIFDNSGSILYAKDELDLTSELKSKIGF